MQLFSEEKQHLIFTILIAVCIMGFVIVGLAIGFLLTGKSHLKKRCGFSPTDREKACPLCKKEKACSEEEGDNRN